ncbi:MAG: SIS domain-containing protein, partial [Acidobacteria bacterium]|nr:SIS domain-containing protein [Acidobacteriota bacterium]
MKMAQKLETAKSSYDKVVCLLRIEANAILRASERLDDQSVRQAVELISKCSGKIVVMGVGKSGVIAQKIAQTLTSTGTIAVFVHPSDALHGSLGVITGGDVVIALSNSGETDEILALLPSLAKRETPLIAIVGNQNSTLSLKSAVSLDASVDK